MRVIPSQMNHMNLTEPLPSARMTRRPDGRVEWVDLVKGIAILLVALYHSALLLLQNELAAPIWDEANEALTAFRMPLFFFASGLFAASIVRRSWPALWRTRLALLVWMFLLWTIIRFVYFAFFPMPERPIESDLVAALLSPLRPMSGLWFLHALIAFFVVGKLIRRVPAWIQITFAALLACAAWAILNFGSVSYNGMARYFLFFMLGMHLRERALAYNERVRPLALLTAGVAFAGAALAVARFHLVVTPGVMPLLGVLAVVTGALGARALASTVVRRPLAYLGRTTLPIYVTHVILVAAVITAIEATGVTVPRGVQLVLPLAVAAVVVTLALLLNRGVLNTPLRFLYAVPKFFAGTGETSPSRIRREPTRLPESV